MILRALLLGSAVAWSVAACTGTVDDDYTQVQGTFCDRGFCDTFTEIAPDAGIGSDAGSADAGSDGGVDAGAGSDAGSGSGSGSSCDGGH